MCLRSEDQAAARACASFAAKAEAFALAITRAAKAATEGVIAFAFTLFAWFKAPLA